MVLLEILLTKLDDDYKHDYFNTFFTPNIRTTKSQQLITSNTQKKDVAKELLKSTYVPEIQ